MADRVERAGEHDACSLYTRTLSALLAWDLVRDDGFSRRACLFRAWDDQYFVQYDHSRPSRVTETVLLTLREARALYARLRVHALDHDEAFPAPALGDD